MNLTKWFFLSWLSKAKENFQTKTQIILGRIQFSYLLQ